MTGGIKEKYNKFFEDGLVPQKRWGFPSDIEKAVNSIVIAKFSFSTGPIILVDRELHIPSL